MKAMFAAYRSILGIILLDVNSVQLSVIESNIA